MRRPSLALRGLLVLLISLTAAPALAQSISLISEPSTIGSGLQSSSARARLSDSQHGGVFVTITVVDSLLARVAPDVNTPGSTSIDVFLPNGSIDAFFVVQALEGATGTAQVDASAPGFTGVSFDVDLVTPYYDITGLSASTDVPDVDDVFRVRVGVAGSPSGPLSPQNARVGGPGLTTELSVDDALVAELVTEFNRGSLVEVFIAPGTSFTPASVTQGGVALDGLTAGSVTVTAQISGLLAQDDAVQTVTVNPPAIGWIGLPAQVGSGLRTANLRARLNGPEHGGVTVDLQSLDPSRVLLAADAADTGSASIQVFIPDGSIDAFFRADGLEGVTGIAAIEATSAGWQSANSVVEVEPSFIDLASVSGSQDTLDPPDDFYARVGRSTNGTSVLPQELRVGGPSVEVQFVVNDSTVALLEANGAVNDTINLPVLPGESGTPIGFLNGGVRLDGIAAGSVTVSASAPGFTLTVGAQKQVTISQPQVTYIGFPATVGSGHVSSLLRARLGATQHGGTTVRIESADPTKVRLSTGQSVPGTDFLEIFVPDGFIDALFYAHTLESVVDTVLVTATASQFQPVVGEVRVVQPGIQLGGLPNGLDLADDVDAFYARVGRPLSSGSTVIAQPLRPDGPGVEVEFTLSDSTIAQLVTTSSTAGSQTIAVAPGQDHTPFNLDDGGLALDGLAPGSVTISATADGYAPISAASNSVDILAATISFIGTAADLGAGLQSALLRARLSGSEHGGALVRIESGDSNAILLTADENLPGSGSVEVFVPNGSIDALFYAQALEGVSATVPLTATATNFVTEGTSVDVVAPAVAILSLGSTLSVGAGPDEFTTRVGTPNSGNTSLQSEQEVRPGASPLEVTVRSDTPAVAELVTLAGSGDSTSVYIFPGESRSPNTIGAGGVGARGLSEGASLIQATADGFVVVGAGQQEVAVASNGIGLAGVPAFLGSRLQTPLLVAQLEDFFHGGVTLTIASDDTNLVLVAPDPISPGAASIQFSLPNGVGSAQYVIQGREGGTGTASVTATAGAAAGSVVFEVVQPALQLVGLPDSLEVVEPDAAFTVQTGVAAASGDSLAQRQAVRSGAGPLDISVVNELGFAAELVTSSLQADSLVVEVQEGSFQSPATVGAGGVALAPTGAGTTAVTASAPEFLTTTRGMTSVVIFGDLTATPSMPRHLALEPNAPNPFNPSTTIRFHLPEAGRVELTVLDLRGRRVRSLVEGELDAGLHTLEWAGRDDRGRAVASGVYFLRLVTRGEQRQQKMVLVK